MPTISAPIKRIFGISRYNTTAGIPHCAYMFSIVHPVGLLIKLINIAPHYSYADAHHKKKRGRLMQGSSIQRHKKAMHMLFLYYYLTENVKMFSDCTIYKTKVIF